MEKMVKCVRNKRMDPSPLARPPRKVAPPPSPASPSTGPSSSSPLYVPDGDGQEGESEQSNPANEQCQEDEQENEPVASATSHGEQRTSQEDDESLEIVGEVDKAGPSETSASRRNGKEVQKSPLVRTAQLKRSAQSRTPEVQGEEQLPTKRVKKTLVVQEAVVETYQPSPNEEWGIDIDECLDVFNMDVGDEYEEKPVNVQVGESSTRVGKSQIYVHMTNNAVHIKTLVTDKDNPQNPGDLKQINQIIHTGPIGMVGRKHVIMSNTEALMKEGLAKEKEIRSLKKELTAQRKLTKELEVSKVPSESLRKMKPLIDGMISVKQKLMEEVLLAVEQFISTLLMLASEGKKLEDVVQERIRMLRILESRKPIMLKIDTIRNLTSEDTKFVKDYWYYLGVLNQIVTRWQEARKGLDAFNDKVVVFISREEFQVKFLDKGDSVRDPNVVTTEVRHLLHNLIMIEDVNSYQFGSHFEFMMKAHTWKSRMLDCVDEVIRAMEGNRPKFREMLRGLERTAVFIDGGFEERVDNLDPPDA